MARRSRVLTFGLPLAAVLALTGATYSIIANTPHRPRTEPLYPPPTAPGRGESIGAVGVVEPASEEIHIGTHVGGVVRDVAVRPGDAVARGATLFVIDDPAARAEVAARRRAVDVARAKLAELQAKIPGARARLAAAEALVRQAQADLADRRDRYGRTLALTRTQAVSNEEVQTQKFGTEGAAARVAAAEADAAAARVELELLDGGGATVQVQRAEVDRAQAALEQAETDLALHTAQAPIDGTVLQVKVRPGEFAPSAVLSQALVVMGRIDPLHVRVSVDEADIPRFDPAAPAFASLRGRASDQARLEFVRTENLVVPKRTLTGAVTERVDTRVLEVIYALLTGQLRAHPGQQVDVYIRVGERE